MAEIKAIYEEHKHRYGYRRITWELRRRGLLVNHKKGVAFNEQNEIIWHSQ